MCFLAWLQCTNPTIYNDYSDKFKGQDTECSFALAFRLVSRVDLLIALWFAMFSFGLVLFSEFYKSAGITKGQDTMLTIAKRNSLWRKLSHSPVDIPVITHSKASWGWLCQQTRPYWEKTKTKNTSSIFLFALSLASTKYPLILFFYPSLFVECF